MSVKVSLAIFFTVFSLGIILVVLLPFLLGRGPVSSRTKDQVKPAPAALGQGIFRSVDGGRTWEEKSAGSSAGESVSAFRVNQLILDPVRPATLYLATDGNGLWISHDRADSWSPLADERGILEPRSNVLALAGNPVNPQEWYVAVFQKNRGRVLRTADGGKAFGEIYFTALERFGVFDVIYERSRGAVAIATGQGGVLESTDRGQTWLVRRWFADGLVRLLLNPLRPEVRFVATSRGSLFRTQDYGESWVDVTPALREFSGAGTHQRWFMDRGGTIYLGSDHGLLRSGDNGASFALLPLIIPPDALPILAIAVDPANSARIIVSALDQLYRSDDGGKTWAILSSPGTKRITHLLFDSERTETVYAVVQP